MTPTKPNNTREPIPKPAAHGLKPPNAKDAKKSINLETCYLAVSIQNLLGNLTILRQIFVIQ